MHYGRYQVVDKIGKGSMGIVYKAHDPQIDRTVALKVLLPDKMTSEEFVRRFLKEAKAIGRLSHPNIVTVFDVGRDHDTIFIAMEFLEGSPLDELFKKKQLDTEDIIGMGIQVAEALDYAHQKGIIHRDIKPSNIILTPNGHAKLTDFGIARIEDPLNQQQTQIGAILGTPAYMSPEQVKGQTIDNRTDLFSIGIILYELCAGKRPFTGDSIVSIFRAIMDSTPPPPKSINSVIPDKLSKVILKSLNKNPGERFQTGKELAFALKKCQSIPKETSTLKVTINKKSKVKTYIMAAILIAIIGLAGISYKLRQNPNIPTTTSTTTPISKTQKLFETQKPLSSPVVFSVETEPSGAQIFLNNAFSGKTPAIINLPLGKYEVLLRLQGHYDWEAQLKLDKEGETPLKVKLLSMNN